MDILSQLKTKINLPESKQVSEYKVLPVEGGHGSCVAFYLKDDLDKASLAFAEKLYSNTTNRTVLAADFGCSPYMPQTLRLAHAGCEVDAFDLEPPIAEFPELNAELGQRIHYHQGDVSQLDESTLKPQYDIIYSNRLALFLNYQTIQTLLKTFHRHLHPEGQLFMSFGMLGSKLDVNYNASHLAPEHRFHTVDNDMARAARITKPLCLLNEEELVNLLNQCGFNIINRYKSSSGFCKAACTKK